MTTTLTIQVTKHLLGCAEMYASQPAHLSTGMLHIRTAGKIVKQQTKRALCFNMLLLCRFVNCFVAGACNTVTHVTCPVFFCYLTLSLLLFILSCAWAGRLHGFSIFRSVLQYYCRSWHIFLISFTLFLVQICRASGQKSNSSTLFGSNVSFGDRRELY